MKIRLDFTGTSKTLFWTQITQKWIKSTAKTIIYTQLDEIFRLVRDLTIFEEKIFLTFFDQRGDPYHENWPKFFFFKYGQITHQSIDLVELSKNMWFLRYFLFIFEWFVSKTVFLRFLKSPFQFSSHFPVDFWSFL